MVYLVAIALFLAVCFGVISFFVRIYNDIIQMRNNADKSFANIDVVLKQRADEVPNITKVVQATALNENTILRELVSLRSQYTSADKANDKIQVAEKMDSKLKAFQVQMEAYPEITASQRHLQLQQRLGQLEDKISSRREFFNDSVNLYNDSIQMFPNNIFAALFRFEKRALLHIGEDEIAYAGVDI